jgi:hypothetical protein
VFLWRCFPSEETTKRRERRLQRHHFFRQTPYHDEVLSGLLEGAQGDAALGAVERLDIVQPLVDANPAPTAPTDWNNCDESTVSVIASMNNLSSGLTK